MNQPGLAHETVRTEAAVRGSSDRSFGLTFAAVFALVGGFSWWMDGAHAVAWLSGAAAFLVLAMAAPRLLRPLNILWLRLGLALNRLLQPVILGLLFFGAILPVALMARIFGHDPLRLRFDSRASTYWVPRTPPGPDPKSLGNQF